MHELQVTGMTCNHCVRTITQAVETVDKTAKVEADLPTGRIKIHSSLPAERFRQAITDAGYAVTV